MELPNNERLSDEERAFIAANRWYGVRVALSVFRGDRRAFDLADVVQAAFLALADAAAAWRRRTGTPACDAKFLRFAGVRIRRACTRFQIENEAAAARTESNLRHARSGAATVRTRAAAVGGRSRPLALAAVRRGVRRGRTGRAFGQRSNEVRCTFSDAQRRAVRAAELAAAAAIGAGPKRRAAALVIYERLPYRRGFRLSPSAVGEPTGLSAVTVERVEAGLVARAGRILRRTAGAIDANAGTLAGAGGADGGLGLADSTEGVCGDEAAA